MRFEIKVTTKVETVYAVEARTGYEAVARLASSFEGGKFQEGSSVRRMSENEIDRKIASPRKAEQAQASLPGTVA